MTRDPLSVSTSSDESSVMASIDEGADGSRLVIADLAREESWLSTPLEVGIDVVEWR